MKTIDRIALIVGVVVIAVMLFGLRRFEVWAETQEPNGSMARPYDCTKKRLAPFVRDSNGKFWSVDVCAVVDSAEGEDFRTEIH